MYIMSNTNIYMHIYVIHIMEIQFEIQFLKDNQINLNKLI